MKPTNKVGSPNNRTTSGDQPEKWTVRQLLHYCETNGLSVEPGLEKPELVRLVDEHLVNCLLRDQLKEQIKLKEEKVSDLLRTPADELLTYRVYPEYAKPLRAHPSKLQEIIAAGMSELRTLRRTVQYRDAERHPPVVAWLSFVAKGEDQGAAMLSALTENASSAVCGRFFSSREMVVRCLDCAADSTCVMCMDCFQHSPCQAHNYRVTPGSGGGMCDCGDPTAWKKESFCSKHSGSASGTDPTASMPPSERPWIEHTLRGMVQFIIATLQQSAVIDERLTKSSSSDTDNNNNNTSENDAPSKKKGGIAAGRDSKNEEEDVRVFAVDRDWVSDWVMPVVTALLELTSNGGDAVRRLLSTYWAEPTPLPSAHVSASRTHRASCLEYIFIFEVEHSFKKKEHAWWTDLVQCVGNCLSDPVFREPFAAMYSVYADRLESLRYSRMRELQVQVFTSCETVQALIAKTLPYPNARDSILHRHLSAALYYMCRLRNNNNSSSIPGCPPWVFSITNDKNEFSASAIHNLYYIMTCCPDAGTMAVSSRNFVRGLATILHLCAMNSEVRKGLEDPMSDAIYTIEQYLYRVFAAMKTRIRHIIRALAVGSTDGVVASPAMVKMIRESRTFDVPPDAGAALPEHSQLLKQASLGDEDLDGLLLPTTSPTSSIILTGTADAAMHFIMSFLSEARRGVEVFLSMQKNAFCKSDNTVVLHRDQCPVYDYNLLAPKEDATTMYENTHRVLSLALHAWLLEVATSCRKGSEGGSSSNNNQSCVEDVRLQGSLLRPSSSWQTTTGTSSPTPLAGSGWVAAHSLADSSNSSSATLDMSRPLRSVTDALFGGGGGGASHARATLEGMLDSLVMPFVLLSQTEQSLWRSNEREVQVHAPSYLISASDMGMEGDVFLLQVSTMCMSPQDFTLRLLQRFMYRKPEDDEEAAAKQKDIKAFIPLGYSRLLRLLLTIILDTSKSNTKPGACGTRHSIHRLVAMLLSTSRLTFSRIALMCSLHTAGASDEKEIDVTDGTTTSGAGATSVEALIPSILQAIATGENTSHGKQFRIKDSETWRRETSLYHPAVADPSVEQMLTMYRSIVRMEKYNSKSGVSSDDHICLPPTEFPRDDEQYEEFRPSLRALLHTDGMLVPALHIVQQYAFNLKTTGVASRKPDNEENDGSESDDDESSPSEDCRVSSTLLLHAITTLYLSMKDCVLVSKAMGVETGVAAAGSTTRSKNNEEEVLWDRVEAYMQRYIAGTNSFTADSAKHFFMLPELTGPQSLKAKLCRPVATSRLGASSSAQEQQQKTVTTVDALHALREYYVTNPKNDDCSLRLMIEYILTTAGVAKFSVAGSGDEKASTAGAMEDRMKKIKEKQAKLMQRLRVHGAKVTADVVGEGGNNQATPSSPSGSGQQQQQLHAKILLELSGLECCVCRISTEEPLLLFGNSASCSSLISVGSVPLLAGDRRVHSSTFTCGHAAHKTCVGKVFTRLAELWRRGYFHGQQYLGPSEFSCPICLMVCNMLCPIPTLITAAQPDAAVAVRNSLTLFEDIQRSTVMGLNPSATTALSSEIEDGMHRIIAQSQVGMSVMQDVAALAPTEDALQRGNQAAWYISETIRAVFTHLNATLEAVKTGLHTINTASDLTTLLSLLVSMEPAKVAKHYEALKANFLKTKEYFCLLILDVIHCAKQASSCIRLYLCAALAIEKEKNTTTSQAFIREALISSSSSSSGHAPIIAIWKELGCLTLLKLLVCEEEASHAVLTPAGTDATQSFVFPTLQASVLETGDAMVEAICTMMGYLLHQPAVAATSTAAKKAPESSLRPAPLLMTKAAATATAGASSPSSASAALTFSNPSAWRDVLLTHVLHLPVEYLTVLQQGAAQKTCAVCSKPSARQVMCCYCGKYMCLLPADGGELLQHSRTCSGGGIGMFLIVSSTRVLVIDTLTGRLLEYPSIYTDAFGEADEFLRRGLRLTRNEELSSVFLMLWLRNEWSVRSNVVKKVFRRELTEL